MKIPTKLKIKRSIWNILYDKQILDSNNAVGLCFTKEKIIYIYPNQSKAEIQHTLTHELLHACFPGGTCTVKREEKIVNHIAQTLHNAGLTISRSRTKSKKRAKTLRHKRST
jgi:Zn-dependent peptidase ImmA (M78 family)